MEIFIILQKKQKNKMYKKISWALIFSATMLVGCGKQIPKNVIQPNDMESILYDYHLSMAMSNNLSYSETYKKAAYNEYVFKKYHITEAQFDSSMVWYTRHTEELARIYSNIGKRFRDEKGKIQKLLAARENKPAQSLPGDTVDVWSAQKLYWLTEASLTNKIAFEIPSDSNFKPKDSFVWSADYTFLSKGKQRAAMGFNIIFDNDSVVIGKVKEFTASGTQTLYIKPDSAYQIKSLNGFIYYMGDSAQNLGMIVNNIKLTRYHEPVDTTATTLSTADSLAVDSLGTKGVDTIKVDTLGLQPADGTPARMNPREMRDNNATTHPSRVRPKRM